MTNSSNIWRDTSIEHIDVKSGNKRCVIVIPVYKNKLGCFEEESLKQVVKIFGGKYELVLLCPMSLDVSIYNQTANYDFSILRCTNEYFKSQKSYSDLCEEWRFYDALSEYEYMVIYQLDAWVFDDRLEYFLNAGYDYIGAPHLIGVGSRPEGENGNGGFCLRRIKPFIDVCKKTDFSKYKMLEDCAFTGTSLKSNFNLAPLKLCREFSFQEYPEMQFAKNNNKLPMGCHAFRKYNERFWKSYIPVYSNSVKYKAEEEQINKVLLESIYGSIDAQRTTRLNSYKKRVVKKRYQ